jgi:hypothetical protein
MQVCSITNNSYRLAYVIPAQYDCAKRTTPVGHGQAKDQTKNKAKAARLSSSAKNEADTFNVLKSVLAKVTVHGKHACTHGSSKTLFDICPVSELIELIRKLWFKCIGTSVYQAQPFRYRHKYHALVVLYLCIKGLKTEDKIGFDIPCCQSIRQHLPPFKKMNQLVSKEFDVSTFTQTNKIFLMCMREIKDKVQR